MIMTVKCWNVICLLLSEQSCSLWPVKQSRFAYHCHGVILSASCLFDDHDCEMLPRSGIECNLLVTIWAGLSGEDCYGQ